MRDVLHTHSWREDDAPSRIESLSPTFPAIRLRSHSSMARKRVSLSFSCHELLIQFNKAHHRIEDDPIRARKVTDPFFSAH